MPHQVLSAQSTQSVTGTVLGAIALILAAAYVFARLARWVRQPLVVGEIIAGIALGPSVLGLLPGDPVGLFFPHEIQPYLQVLAQLGLILFMFGIGYQFDSSHMRGHGRLVTSVSVTSVALPFALGAGLTVVMFPWFDTEEMKSDGLLVPALFLGAAMSITAFPVLARIISERGLHKHPIGGLATACAAIQDFLAWTILAVVVAVANSSGFASVIRMVVLFAALLLALVYVVRPAIVRLFTLRRTRVGSAAIQTVLVVGLLLSAWATESMGLHAVFGAFAFGATVPRREIEAAAPEVPERIEQTSLFLLPVFFVVTGLSVDIGGLGGQGVLMLLAVLVVACTGKFAGAAGAARLTGATGRDAAALGILLNARGLTELVILDVGLTLGALDSRTFTVMVVMAVATTVMTGPLLHRFRLPALPERPVTGPGRSGRALVTARDDPA
ncbi:cation:proton antiporter [Streptomyces sp. NPDC016469]|uniref:cation:proton antiporter n=1 Tax=Streptomyces sp. NPDC016469 TaxID=3157191 RepID=UPI0033C1E688